MSFYNNVDYNARILYTLKEYVALRKYIAAIAEPSISPPAAVTETAEHPTLPDAPVNGVAKPTIHVPKSTRHTQHLLTNVAQMADANVRSSREKLNIARFSCGLVRPKVLSLASISFDIVVRRLTVISETLTVLSRSKKQPLPLVFVPVRIQHTLSYQRLCLHPDREL